MVVNSDNLLRWVGELSGLRHGGENPVALEDRAVRIEQLLAGLGLEVVSQEVAFADRVYRTLVATLPGCEPQLPMLLLGAH